MLNRVRVRWGFMGGRSYGGFYGVCPVCGVNARWTARYGALTITHQKTCGGCRMKFWWKYVSEAGVPGVGVSPPRFIHVEVELKRWW